MAKAMNFSIKLRERTQRGFSLLELSIAMVILAVVIAVIVSGVTQLQKTNVSQAINVDLTQESRQFMDQIEIAYLPGLNRLLPQDAPERLARPQP